MLQKEFHQLCERYNSLFEAYTDGSNCEQKVAADNSLALQLREGSFVFNAELEGILLALKKFTALRKTIRFLPFTLAVFLLLKACKEKLIVSTV